MALPSIYEAATKQAILERLDRFTPASPRQWGKMNHAQMLAHCAGAIELALGERKPKRELMGYIVGPIFKYQLTQDKPYQRNSPTSSSVLITDEYEFEEQKARLRGLIERFHQTSGVGVGTHPHPIFGKLSAEVWGTSGYKHLNHHFTQFSV